MRFVCIADMRRDVQEIFRSTPHGKQVMMFSATLSKDIRPICKKFMQDVNIMMSIINLLLLLLQLVQQKIHSYTTTKRYLGSVISPDMTSSKALFSFSLFPS